LLAGNWGVWVTLASLGLMLAFAYTYSGFGGSFYRRAKALKLAAALLALLIGLEAVDRGRFRVTALDVGQGSSYVFSAEGHSFVMGGGGNNQLLGMNTGNRVIMPYLDHRGIKKVDAAFVTGASRQQIMGLIELAMAGRAEAIYIPSELDVDSGLGMRLRIAAERSNIPIYRLEAGDSVHAGGMTVTVESSSPQLLLHVAYNGSVVQLP